MTPALHTEAPPLRQDTTGALRVGTSRVLVELVIHAFQDGATPEAIQQRYPSITLAEVYGVIAYYLRHQSELDQYLAGREALASEVRERIEARQDDLGAIRRRLLARQSA